MNEAIEVCIDCGREHATEANTGGRVKPGHCYRKLAAGFERHNEFASGAALHDCVGAGRVRLPTPEGQVPIPMILFCPLCRIQHIDKPNPEKAWDNPPHRSHECENCGLVWRPADVATVGVEQIATEGKHDSFKWPFAAKAIFKAVLIDYSVIHAFAREIERSGVRYSRLCELVRRAVRFHLPDPNDRMPADNYEVESAIRHIHVNNIEMDNAPAFEQIMGLHRPDRKEAEQAYADNAFDYVNNPIGSPEWCLFWKGWRAARADRPVQPDAEVN
jgi:hypothetical protein